MTNRQIVMCIALSLSFLVVYSDLYASHVPGDYPTIQEALNHAVASEEIIVSDGTYYEHILWPNVDGIVLRSASSDATRCIIDGSLEAGPVVQADVAAPLSMGLLNLTIQGGTQNTTYSAGGIFVRSETGGAGLELEGCILKNNTGSAIRTINVDVEARHCTVTENHVYTGASVLAVWTEGGNVTFTNNTVTDNEIPGVGLYGGTANIYVTVEKNIITRNMHGLIVQSGLGYNLSGNISSNLVAYNGYDASPATSLVVGLGFSATSPASELVIKENTIRANNSMGTDTVSFAVLGTATGQLRFERNSISDHLATNTAIGLLMYLYSGVAEVRGNKIYNNGAPQAIALGIVPYKDAAGTCIVTNNFITANNAQGIAIGEEYAGGNYYSFHLVNNTVADNTQSGISSMTTSPIYVTNSIVWGNNDDLLNVEATYSDIGDGDSGEGNISLPPLLVSPSTGNYHITSGSPCIDAGTAAAPYVPFDDYDGNARDALPDMGADEYVANTTPEDPFVEYPEISQQNVSVGFGTVTEAGQTTVDSVVDTPALPEDFVLLEQPSTVYVVATSAQHIGPVTVCVRYDQPPATVNEAAIRLLQEEDGVFIDHTSGLDTSLNRVCATSDALSAYVVAYTTQQQGCFIATVAFGTPLDRRIDLLRGLRDDFLTPTRIGRQFVDQYYRYSPTIAAWVAPHSWIRHALRLLLYPVVGLAMLIQ